MSSAAKTAVFSVDGMTCNSCSNTIQHVMATEEGVKDIAVSFITEKASIKFDPTLISIEKLQQAITELGFPATPFDPTKKKAPVKKALPINVWLPFLFGIPLMILCPLGVIPAVASFAGSIIWGLIAVATAAISIYTSWDIYQQAFQSLRQGNLNMKTLIAVSTLAAFTLSLAVVMTPGSFPDMAQHTYFEVVTMLLGITHFETYLKQQAKHIASEELLKQGSLMPSEKVYVKTLTHELTEEMLGDRVLLQNGDIKILDKVLLRELQQQQNTIYLQRDTYTIKPGTVIRVQTDMRIPLDGTVSQGTAQVDEAAITGESAAVQKNQNDIIRAGATNVSQPFDFTVTKSLDNSYLASLHQSIKKSESETKTKLNDLIDTVAKYFVPAVLAIAALTGIGWYVFGPEPSIAYAISTALSVLTVSCPCSLGLTRPLTLTAARSVCAKENVLVQQQSILERAHAVDTVVFDKTGTLVQPSVTHIHSYDTSFSKNKLLQWAAALEQRTYHPFAHAIRAKATTEKLSLVQVAKNEIQTHGQGVAGIIDNQQALLGSAAFLAAQHIHISTQAQQQANRLGAQGISPVFLAVENQIKGVFGFQNTLRPDAKAVVETLKKAGKKIYMATGDKSNVAHTIAAQLGIEAQHVFAELKTKTDLEDENESDQIQTKHALLTKLEKDGHVIAMVGDGDNDLEAMAKPNVISFAMESAAKGAHCTADVILKNDDLFGVEKTMLISKSTMRHMKQNIFWAFFYNVFAIPTAAGAFYSLGFMMTPIKGALSMLSSMVLIIGNSLRLKLIKLPDYAAKLLNTHFHSSTASVMDELQPTPTSKPSITQQISQTLTSAAYKAFDFFRYLASPAPSFDKPQAEATLPHILK